MPNPNNTKKAGGYRDDMPRQPLRERPAFYDRRDGNTRDNDVYLNPNMPKDTPVMRAPTMKERVGDTIRGAYSSLAEQPLVRIADMLGLSNIKGVANENPNDMKQGMMMGGPGNLAKLGMNRGVMGKSLAPDVEMMHPAVPPEFHAVAKAKMPQSRTAPIDMDNLPSGKMEYLDPDVAEYMNPSGLDVTTKEGQRRLRFLTGK